MAMLLRHAVVVLALLAAGTAATAQPALRAPNLVEATARLTTAGQPSAQSLAELRALGFDAVIYLVPPTASDAVRDEAYIVGRQGLVFVNLPIRFDGPTVQDFETFAAIMQSLKDRKVLVHCQVNMRASMFVFLYRTIHLREDPVVAYESVSRVWTPDGPWKRLMQQQLRAHKIDFDPF